MSSISHRYTTSSPEETQALAGELIEHIFSSRVVLLHGNLGTGKTTFVKGLAKALGIDQAIKSPTYTYVHKYKVQDSKSKAETLYHFDLYRLAENLEHPEHTAAEIGLADALESPNSIVVIEWPERLPFLNGRSLQFEKEGDQHYITVMS